MLMETLLLGLPQLLRLFFVLHVGSRALVSQAAFGEAGTGVSGKNPCRRS